MKQRKRRKFKRAGKFWVYIVECCDGTFYTGYTPNVEKRLELHNNGKGAKYTRDRRPVELVWSKEYKYFKKAFLMEKRIKGLTREQKEKLVGGKRLDKVLAEASGRQACGVNVAQQDLPRGGADTAAKCSRVYIKTFGCKMAAMLHTDFTIVG